MDRDADCSDPQCLNAFQEWFEGSKVVDEAGNPVVVYHGTPCGDFEQFDISRAERDAFRSIWFSECEGQALIYALGQKKSPRSIVPVLEQLCKQQPEATAEVSAFEQTIRVVTYPDGTPWECFDKQWLCDNSNLFDYHDALRRAYPEPNSPRIHRAYLRAVRPYIGADESIARRLGKSDCMYDSYLSVMAPYAEWAIPSEQQIWMLDANTPRESTVAGMTFGMAHTAAGLGKQWSYDRAARLAERAPASFYAHSNSAASAAIS